MFYINHVLLCHLALTTTVTRAVVGRGHHMASVNDVIVIAQMQHFLVVHGMWV